MRNRHYAWYRSMIVKQLALFLALFTPIIALFAYLTNSFSAEIWDSTTQLMRTQDMILFQTMEQQLSDLNLLQYTLLSDDNILMLQALYDRFSEHERAQRIGEIQNRLLWLKKSNGLIREASLFMPAQKLRITSSTYRKLTDDDMAYQQRLLGWQNRLAVIDGSLLMIAESNIKTGQRGTAVSVLQVMPVYFKQLMAQITKGTESGAVLMANADVVAASGDDKNLLEDVLAQLKTQGDVPLSGAVRVGGEKLVAYTIDSDALGLSMTRYRPEGLLQARLSWVRDTLWLMLVLGCAVLALFLWYMSHFIRRPITKLIKAFEQMEAGREGVRAQSRMADEFSVLYDSFNHMSEKLDNTLNQVYKQRIIIQRSELKQLQSQIDPHFLYNTFFILRRRIKKQETQGAMELADLLGNYFMYITRSGRDFIPLGEEVRHAQVYAQIQKTRFRNKLELVFPPPNDGYAALTVPRLILQPFVENAVKYVVEKSDELVRVCVSYTYPKGYIEIRIEDSGEDVTDADVAALNEMLDTSMQRETTALVNIHQRLRLQYGPGAGITFSRSTLGGLCSVIRICAEEVSGI